MKLKKVTAILLTAVMTAALAACGSSSGDSSGSSGDDAGGSGKSRRARHERGKYLGRRNKMRA